MSDDTLLDISAPGIVPFSARGATHTMEPIAASIHLERDVNGTMVDLSIPAMRKYKSKITCTDMNVPAFGGLWPGAVITVDCAFELAYLTSQPAFKERNEVPGSVRIDGDYTFYRPRLTMVVMPFNNSFDEWQANNGWELELEEQ